ncbi:UNVERIFIED_CONTAM: hypothetical protein GTU68_009475 [Idotea baltica]
MSFSW